MTENLIKKLLALTNFSQNIAKANELGHFFRNKDALNLILSLLLFNNIIKKSIKKTHDIPLA